VKDVRSIKIEILMKTFGAFFKVNHENRLQSLEKENLNLNCYDIVNVDVSFENEYLFLIFKKIHPYLRERYDSFIRKLFELLDKVDDIEKTSSVSTQDEISVYKVMFKDESFTPSSYDQLSKITLLEHIDDIVSELIQDYKKNELNRNTEAFDKTFTHTELEQQLLLAIFHDIGKIFNLMKKFGINFNDKNHEERGVIFLDILYEGDFLTDNEKKGILRLRGNMKLIAEKKIGTRNTLKRFHKYDSRARVLELNRLIEGEKR